MYKKINAGVVEFLNNHTLAFALLIAIALIGLTVGFGWYNNRVVIHTTNPIARYKGEPSNPLSFMSNWDGPDYISLADHGYQNVSQASFYPAYPLLIRLVSKVINSPLDSALLISWILLVGGIYYYLKILRQMFNLKDNISAIQGVIFFVLFPTAVFLVATYTESLLVFSSLAAIYYALNRNYLAVGLFGLVATVTNTDGILALILACLILLEEKVKVSKVTISFITGLLGLAGYSYYLDNKFSRPLSFITAQKSHGWINFHYSELFATIDFFNVIFIGLLIASTVYWWRRRRSFSIYSLLFLLIPVIGNQFGGFNRYVLLCFPMQFMAYDYLKSRRLAYSLILAGMGIVWAYFTFQYAGGYVGG